MSHLKSEKKRSGDAAKIVLMVVAVIVIIVAVIIAASTISSALGCPSKKQCQEVIEDFQESCNSLDAEGILDCLDPTIANPLKAALFVGSVVTSSTTDILTSILEAVGGDVLSFTDGTDMDLSSAFEVLTIEPKRFGLPKKSRKVRCKVTIGTITQYMNIYVAKKNGDAYISKVELAN